MEDLEKEPLSLWRRVIRSPVYPLLRLQLFLCGFHWIEVEGTPAPREVAPVMVANHTTVSDPVALFALNAASVVSREENGAMPVIGGILKSLQTLFVNRAGTPEERLAVKEAMLRRATDDRMPRLLVFPEATCTNGRAVITFKLGPFAPLLPVQPVVVTYPLGGGFDPCWVNGGPGLFGVMLGLMLQVHNRMRVRYLDVVRPDPPAPGVAAGSNAHAAAFARKTQVLMAEAMGVPTTEHSFLDVILSGKALKLKYPAGAIAPGLAAFRGILDVDAASTSAILEAFVAADRDRDGCLTVAEWCSFFEERAAGRFSPADAVAHREQLESVFVMLDESEDGLLDFREFLVGLSVLSGRAKAEPAVLYRTLFRALAGTSRGALDREAFASVARRAFPESDPADAAAAFDVARGEAGVVDEEAFVRYLTVRAEVADAYRDALLDLGTSPKAAPEKTGPPSRSAKVAPAPLE